MISFFVYPLTLAATEASCDRGKLRQKQAATEASCDRGKLRQRQAATEAGCDRGKLRQRLSSHLEACVRVAVQTNFTVEDFPFDLALEVLRAQEKD